MGLPKTVLLCIPRLLWSAASGIPYAWLHYRNRLLRRRHPTVGRGSLAVGVGSAEGCRRRLSSAQIVLGRGHVAVGVEHHRRQMTTWGPPWARTARRRRSHLCRGPGRRRRLHPMPRVCPSVYRRHVLAPQGSQRQPTPRAMPSAHLSLMPRARPSAQLPLCRGQGRRHRPAIWHMRSPMPRAMPSA